jgi:FkbM family methyltransferase
MVDRQKSAGDLADTFKKIVVDILQPSAFYEIGAFNAETSIHIKRHLANCDVYAFEANPYNFNEFKKEAIDSNIQYMYSAISNETGTAIFNIQAKKKNKELEPIRGNNSLFERNEKGVHYEKVTVPVETIDNYFKSKHTTVCMWIDVEGKGYEVLSGAKNSLIDTKLILIEVESYQFWKDQKLDTDIIKLLKSHNFLPIARDYETENQYNILFCKESEISNTLITELVKKYQEKYLL